MKLSRVLLVSGLVMTGTVVLASGPLGAQAIQNPLAVFAGLDKITGRITTFEIPVDEVRRFGALNVYPRICNSRPPTEEPKTTSFVQVDENLLSGGTRRIFSGWMLAESPGLNAVEHPVYDVWLIGCRDPNRKSVDDEQTGIPPAQTGPSTQDAQETQPQQ
ncbi:MAG: DUF2155 domain-containing protein [Anderseniella sp.]